MGLVKGIDLLVDAKKNKRAVGAFNFTNLEQLKAIVSASIETNTGCFLSTSESAVEYMGIKNIVDMVKNEVENLSLNFALHLDHGKSFEICKQCVDAGYTSVMIDGSKLSTTDNINLTKKVVVYAHKYNVSVEGEIGKIQGIEDNTESKDSILTSPIDAQNFIKNTNVDSLAISIGTSHGAYKFKGESKLEIDLLNEIDKVTNHFPLVLHGASSVSQSLVENFNNMGGNLTTAKGVDDKSIIDAINGGICKINVDTDLRIAFTTGVREILNDKKIYSPRDYLTKATEVMKSEVINRIILFNNKL